MVDTVLPTPYFGEMKKRTTQLCDAMCDQTSSSLEDFGSLFKTAFLKSWHFPKCSEDLLFEATLLKKKTLWTTWWQRDEFKWRKERNHPAAPALQNASEIRASLARAPLTSRWISVGPQRWGPHWAMPRRNFDLELGRCWEHETNIKHDWAKPIKRYAIYNLYSFFFFHSFFLSFCLSFFHSFILSLSCSQSLPLSLYGRA